jgi:hypothetical protein
MKITYLFTILFLSGFGLFGLMHEKVHETIYSNYGIKSHIEIRFPDLVTVAEKGCTTENCEMAHEMNEVVGYHAMPFYFIIGFGFLFIIGLMEKYYE